MDDSALTPQRRVRTVDTAVSPMVFAHVDSTPATPAPASGVEMGTAMTPVTAPELSALVGMPRDELVAQLESVAISNEMLRQAAKETETRLADVNRQTALHRRQQDALATELAQARAELQSLQETDREAAGARASMQAALEEAEGSVQQLTVWQGRGC